MELPDDLAYCPFCGSQQRNDQMFCTSCGAKLTDLNIEDNIESSIKILRETPLSHEDEIQTRRLMNNQPSGSYVPNQSYTTYYVPTQTTPRDNATIAIVMAILGFVFNCFILPIIGISLANKAERLGEDKQTVQIAKVLNYILLVLTAIGIVAAILYFTFLGGFRYY